MATKPAGRMYVKPVMGASPSANVGQVLRMLKTELHKRIKNAIQATAFSQRAKRAFSKAVQIKLQPRSLLIQTKHPGFMPMLKGQVKEQMRWLAKAQRPIPIITDQGKLIFRWASPRSMADGKWVHPGRNPSSFIDQAKKEARTFVKAKLAKQLLAQVRAAMNGK